MSKQVRISYQKTVDASSTDPWAQGIFHDSYTEFLLQLQNFVNMGDWPSFSFKKFSGNSANTDRLNFLVSTAITGYLQQLANIIPDVRNNNGHLFLPFQQFKFEIITSSPTDRSLHAVAVSFFSDWVEWVATAGNYLLLSLKNDEEQVYIDQLLLQPGVSIFSVKPGHGK